MRWLLILVAVGAAGTAGYLSTFAKNSFSAYSSEQLDLLDRELSQELAQESGTSRPSKNSAKQAERQAQLAANQQLLLEERQRRFSFYLALGLAGVTGVAATLLRGGGSSSPKLRGSGDEDARLLAAIGDPAVLRAGARQKAAALLGVSPEAPPAVIEAALQAQLQQRDLSRLDGLAPDLQKLALQQREELIRARDLLLNPASSKPAGSRGS